MKLIQVNPKTVIYTISEKERKKLNIDFDSVTSGIDSMTDHERNFINELVKNAAQYICTGDETLGVIISYDEETDDMGITVTSESPDFEIDSETDITPVINELMEQYYDRIYKDDTAEISSHIEDVAILFKNMKDVIDFVVKTRNILKKIDPKSCLIKDNGAYYFIIGRNNEDISDSIMFLYDFGCKVIDDPAELTDILHSRTVECIIGENAINSLLTVAGVNA